MEEIKSLEKNETWDVIELTNVGKFMLVASGFLQ